VASGYPWKQVHEFIRLFEIWMMRLKPDGLLFGLTGEAFFVLEQGQ
jgi:hypothetical protein